MARIIVDTLHKKDKAIWGNDRQDAFNKKIVAVNDMYLWLYDRGILESVSFVFKDYADTAYFALDTKSLEPYRKLMEASRAADAALAVHHIFDEAYTPCEYSGAIELGWTMASYRDVDGIVGRSWECSLVKSLNTDGIYAVNKVKEEQGVKAAVEALFSEFDWNLTLQEQKVYQAALKHFEMDANGIEHIEGISERKLIYCYENNESLMDFDFWCRYEFLCGEDITYDEYLAIDSTFDGDPHDIEESDLETISDFKKALENYRKASHSNKLQNGIEKQAIKFSSLMPDAIGRELDLFFEKNNWELQIWNTGTTAGYQVFFGDNVQVDNLYECGFPYLYEKDELLAFAKDFYDRKICERKSPLEDKILSASSKATSGNADLPSLQKEVDIDL